MKDYKLSNLTFGGFTYVIRNYNGALIPSDFLNIDYQAYLAWISEGNEPDPADE